MNKPCTISYKKSMFVYLLIVKDSLNSNNTIRSWPKKRAVTVSFTKSRGNVVMMISRPSVKKLNT
jgi:hypothetical protein